MSIFKDAEIVNEILSVLLSVCSREQFVVLAYCFMPDHLHLLLAGEEKSELVETLKTFKQVTAHGFKKGHGKPLWQRGYYDHIVRKETDLMIVADYIWSNPVRKGLADTNLDYPFSGPRAYLTVRPA